MRIRGFRADSRIGMAWCAGPPAASVGYTAHADLAAPWPLKHVRSENLWLGCSRFVTQFEHRRDQLRFIPGDVDRMLAQPVTLGVAQPLLRKIHADVLLTRVELDACGIR